MFNTLRMKNGYSAVPFWTGLLRGFGTAVGVTVLGAVIIYAFQALAKSNLPYIADFISDIIDIIEKTRK